MSMVAVAHTKPQANQKKSESDRAATPVKETTAPVALGAPVVRGVFANPTPRLGLGVPVQAKIVVGQSNDPYEREADHVANRVTAGFGAPSISVFPDVATSTKRRDPQPQMQEAEEEDAEAEMLQPRLIQRQPENDERDEEELIQRQPITEQEEDVLSDTNSTIQRKCAACAAEEEKRKAARQEAGDEVQYSLEPIQAKCAACAAAEKEQNEEAAVQTKFASQTQPHHQAVSQPIATRLNQSEGRGRGLDKSIRLQMESAFGTDFTGVRIHQDSQSAALNRELGAHAFTNGAHIHFNHDKYNPSSQDGKRLLAHELTHTIQQGAATTASTRRGSVQPTLIQREEDCETENEERGSEEQAAQAETAQSNAACEERNPPAEQPPEGTEEPEQEETPADVEAREGAPVDERQSNAPPPNENAPASEEDIAESSEEAEAAPQDPCAVREDTGVATGEGEEGIATASSSADGEMAQQLVSPVMEEFPAPAGESEASPEAAEREGGGGDAFLAAAVAETRMAPSPEGQGEAASPDVVAERDSEVTSADNALAALNETAIVASTLTAGDLTFIAPADDGARGDYQYANSVANAFLSEAGTRLSEFIARGMDAAGRLRSDTEQRKANLQASVQQRRAHTAALMEQLRANAQAQADGAIEQIKAKHILTTVGIELQALTAKLQIGLTYDTKRQDLEKAHTDQVTKLEKVYSTGYDDLIQIGRIKAQEAEDRATEHARAYRNAENAPDEETKRKVVNREKDGFWDGYLTYNRYMARADAAEEVGKQYSEGFTKEAQAQADNMMCGKAKDIELCSAILMKGLESLVCARDNETDAIESQRQSAIAMAEASQAESLGKIRQSLKATKAQLDAREASQLALLNDYGIRQELAIERDSERAVTAVLQGVNEGAAQIVAYLSQFRTQVQRTEAPPHDELSTLIAGESAQFSDSLMRAEATLDGALVQAQSSLDMGREQALSALNQMVQGGAEDARALASGFSQGMQALLSGTMSGYEQIATTFSEGVSAELENSTAVLDGVVTGITGLYAQINSGTEAKFQQTGTQMEQGFQQSLDEDLDQKVCVEAEKAAAEIHPWWKDVLKVLLIIVVIVVVAIVLGPAIIGAVGAAATALAGSLGAGAALAGTIGAWLGPIIGGAIVGALAGAAIQIGDNAIYGRAWDTGIKQAIIAGAIGGALGGLGGQLGQVLVGRFASTAFSRFALQYGTDVVFDIAGGILGDLAAGNPITWESIVMGLAIGGAVQISMGGLGRLAARAPAARARASAGGAEGSGSRLSRGADLLARGAERVTSVQRGAMELGERAGARVGAVGSGAPTVGATRTALNFARQRIDAGEMAPTQSGHEPVGWRGPDSRPPIGSIIDEMPIALGGSRHTLKQVEGSDGPQYVLCSLCGPVIPKVDNLLARTDLDPAVRGRLQELRVEIQDINLREGRFPDPDTRRNHIHRMMRIVAEIDDMIPGAIYGEISAGRPRQDLFDELGNTDIARRARELFSGNQRAIRDFWKDFRSELQGPKGKELRTHLNEAIENQARGRSLTQAQEDIRGAPQRLEPGAPAREVIDPDIDYPFGFYSRADFDDFSRELYRNLPDGELILTGSSVTGRRFRRIGVEGYTDTPFNVGRMSHGGLSDYDVSIVSPSLFARAEASGIRIEDGSTIVLGRDALDGLGLLDLHNAAQRAIIDATGIPHEVNFKIYPSPGGATERPHIPLSR